jgi:hypothetical protein
MARCKAEALFDELYQLLKAWHVNDELSPSDRRLLQAAIRRWKKIECPDGERHCLPRQCLFADPIDWVEYYDYPDLAALIDRLQPWRLPKRIPRSRKSMDMWRTERWARQPGDYRPQRDELGRASHGNV